MFSAPLALRPSPPLRRQEAALMHTHTSARNGTDKEQGGTACRCICGDRIVWQREVFDGHVKAEKEKECEHEICPRHQIPGLEVQAQCTEVNDIKELTAGTVCQCRCGDKIAWRNRGFYGDVKEEKEAECLKSICPRVNPVPGIRFEAQCIYDEDLFARHRTQGGQRMSASVTAVPRCALIVTLLAMLTRAS